MVAWPATQRYELEAAPGGLGLAQDLLNTFSAGAPKQPDLLADVTAAARWAEVVTAGEVVLTAGDVEELRAFRNDLQSLVSGEHQRALPWAGTVALEFGDDGSVQLRSTGNGAQLLISMVLAALFEGQQADTWRRLKTCRNPRCQVAFYDRSRNNSGVWHSLRTCGNPANLRAHRARNREQNS